MASHESGTPDAERGAIERLIKLYDAWGKPDKADEWWAKLAEFEAASGE